ncbi:uncharacterized protein ASCRUDRAFT_73112 [Ascoidea rubescens DSM 1968]|uniref:NAA35-like TPR repeats domain-containing protein n=1 Tax=Ascoidea rubescens DSM 1968 TaxID=1344418 RepID=A0A1D2V843_9ASCO|nr:hypothetical protein ASCRUDRAFT_73112 [Ascoidea rubescens DSM 1968]ODV57816.1 hypothetical protein ASCRUDRAFT_73112 [Ascoidea rubescens DSM 1968]
MIGIGSYLEMNKMMVNFSRKHILSYNEYGSKKEDINNSILIRSFLQYILIRADKSVLGNGDLELCEMYLNDLKYFTCYCNPIFEIYDFSLKSKKSEKSEKSEKSKKDNQHKKDKKKEIEDSKEFSKEDKLVYKLIELDLNGDRVIRKDKQEMVERTIEEFLGILEGGYLELEMRFSSNICRQRQKLNSLICTFDSIQQLAEQVDHKLVKIMYDNDNKLNKVNSNGGDDILIFMTYVYYKKIEIMINFLFEGFKLEVYKKWEYDIVYYNLKKLIESNLIVLEYILDYNKFKREKVERIIEENLKDKNGGINLKKISLVNSINKLDIDESHYNNKKKNKKNINNLKRKKNIILDEKLNKLNKIEKFLVNLIKDYEIKLILTEIELKTVKIYEKNGFIGLPKFNQIEEILQKQNREYDFASSIYSLRMKPFYTVQLPEFQSYDKYEKYKRDTDKAYEQGKCIEEIKMLNQEGKIRIMEMVREIERDQEALGTRLIVKESIQWYSEMMRSSIGMYSSVLKLSKMRKEAKAAGEAKTAKTPRAEVVRTQYHRFFPVMVLEPPLQ